VTHHQLEFLHNYNIIPQMSFHGSFQSYKSVNINCLTVLCNYLGYLFRLLITLCFVMFRLIVFVCSCLQYNNINSLVTVLRSKLHYMILLKNRKITKFDTFQFYLSLKIMKLNTHEIWHMIFHGIKINTREIKREY